MYKVLIIEDDPPYRKIYQKKFEVSGYEVEVAEDGIAGLQKMRTFRPDIALIDLMMPRMDGFQVLDAVKADPTLQSIPTLVLTNLSSTESAEKALEKGALAILVKSDIEPEGIVQKANEILGSKN